MTRKTASEKFSLDELVSEAGRGPVVDARRQKYEELLASLRSVGDTHPLTFEEFVAAQDRSIDWGMTEDEHGNIDPDHLRRITPKVLPD